jgi:DNA-3-methyladenine glycosylase
MGISGIQNGIDLVTARQGFAVVSDGMAPPAGMQGGPRVGIRLGKDLPWRWCVPGSRYVSGRAQPAR